MLNSVAQTVTGTGNLQNDGTVNWTQGRLRSGNGGGITNRAQWNDSASTAFRNDYGGTYSFTNAAAGTYNKTAAGTTGSLKRSAGGRHSTGAPLAAPVATLLGSATSARGAGTRSRITRAGANHTAIANGTNRAAASSTATKASRGQKRRITDQGDAPTWSVPSSAARRLAAAQPATFVIFDLLQLDDRDPMSLPYSDRRARLAELRPA